MATDSVDFEELLPLLDASVTANDASAPFKARRHRQFTFQLSADSRTLVSSNVQPSDGNTVTAGGKVYTFKTTLTPLEGEVLISLVDADHTDLNLISAINHTGTPDTDYSCAAANAVVSAAVGTVAHSVVVTARVPGTAITVAVTGATLSWTAMASANVQFCLEVVPVHWTTLGAIPAGNYAQVEGVFMWLRVMRDSGTEPCTCLMLRGMLDGSE
jgi:hypothetical protein